VFLANVKGLRSYQPRRFDGVVTLFRTRPPGESVSEDVLQNCMRKWSNRVNVHEAPGTHMTLMLDPRVAARFAPFFEATLDPESKHASAR
jgi:thioesterase domain-containing protein